MATASRSLAPLPVLFLSHGGGPANFLDGKGSMFQAIDKNSRSARFLKTLPKVLESYSSTPVKSILVVSAHWEETVFTVDRQPGKTKLIYDYYGFPDETYAPHLTYPVGTDLALADRVESLLRTGGLPVETKNRGFDHGTFIPLKVAFPEANIPVVQLSLKGNLNIADHIRLGELLRPLRDEGVLIIASGQMTHNLGAMGKSDSRASAFVNWIHSFLTGSTSSNYEEKKAQYLTMRTTAPHYAYCHPRDEHFIPLAVAFGAGFGEATTTETRVERIYEEIVLGTMSIDHYAFFSPTCASNTA